MDKLNIHNLLITFISNNKLLFVFYILILIIQYPIFYIYIPEYYGKVINSFKDNNTPLLNKYMGLLTLLYITKLVCSLLVQTVLYFMIPNFTEYATGSIFEFIINHYENDFENIKPKKEFIELVYGQWKYLNDSRPLTKATFSMDIPTKAIKILSYKNDVILDPFCGSGTSLVAAQVLDRRWIGIELSPNYCKVAQSRVDYFKTLEEIKEDQL